MKKLVILFVSVVVCYLMNANVDFIDSLEDFTANTNVNSTFMFQDGCMTPGFECQDPYSDPFTDPYQNNSVFTYEPVEQRDGTWKCRWNVCEVQRLGENDFAICDTGDNRCVMFGYISSPDNMPNPSFDVNGNQACVSRDQSCADYYEGQPYSAPDICFYCNL